MTNKIILTKEGFAKLKKELEDLKKIKLPKALERLKKARSLGDLTESSEYSSAREDLELIERRIEEIEVVLEKAEIAQTNQKQTVVQIGSRITALVNGHKEEFLIVGEFEGDPKNKKISCSSPIGKSLIGKKVGDLVEVEVPAGKTKYKIIKIN